jgi:hypothetical protein
MIMARKILLWIWCFPQMFLGFLVKVLTRARRTGAHYEYGIQCGSLSLGEYMFLCPGHYYDPDALKHEFGHTRQSRILGWLWLPIVGIPSIIWAGCFDGYRKSHRVDYYAFYTETWADKLGGVSRSKD